MMNKGLWLARKNYLLTLMKKVSDLQGGDDTETFRQHCVEVIESCPEEEIEEAISCYLGILDCLKLRQGIEI